jgi:hypothetical protein
MCQITIDRCGAHRQKFLADPGAVTRFAVDALTGDYSKSRVKRIDRTKFLPLKQPLSAQIFCNTCKQM